MQYDPIKRSLGKVFNQTPSLRKTFYGMLDILLLRAWHINSMLRKLELPQKANILDAGSGFGQYSFRMSRIFKQAQILAVDVKEEQIADCNRFFQAINEDDRVKFEVGDLTTFSQANKFELILSVDVMEHIEEDVQVFRNFYHSMKAGGVLLISTPSDQGGSDSHHDHEEGAHGFIDEHVRDGYSIDDISTKLKSVGFSTIEAKYSYGTAGKISWKLSMKYPILLLGVSKLFFIALPFYYLLVFPFCLLLNWIDLHTKHSSGTGLIVKAIK
ncbi:MAG: class I SAM-dependent methyltransferase [Mangrovibacterium sp.]